MGLNPKRLRWLKVKRSLGTALSENPQLASAANDLHETVDFVADILARCKAHLAWLKASPRHALTADMLRFYKQADCRDATRSDDDEAAVVQRVVKELSDFASISGSCEESSEMASRQYEAEVIEPLERWLAECKALSARVTANEEWHVVFDHYSRKLASLSMQINKVADTPKDTPKLREQFSRNARKLVMARDGFERSNRALLADMRGMFTGRFAVLAPVASGYLRYHEERHAAMSKRG